VRGEDFLVVMQEKKEEGKKKKFHTANSIIYRKR